MQLAAKTLGIRGYGTRVPPAVVAASFYACSMNAPLAPEELRAEAERASWRFLEELMSRSGRCAEGREAGLWALGVMKRILGPEWPARSRAKEGSVPPELSDASFHAVAYVELLRMATALSECESVPGVARLRSALKNDFREEVRAHVRGQLELAVLGAVVGAEPSFEQLVGGKAPTDVSIRMGNKVVPIEVRVVTKDEQMRAGDELADKFQSQLRRIQFEHDVHLTGDLSALSAEALPGLTEAIEAAARAARASQSEEWVAHPLAPAMKAIPAALAESGMQYSFPGGAGRGLSRTAGILRAKLEQTRKSRSSWLRVDLLDGTWMFSELAQMEFGTRARALATFAASALGEDSGLHGVAISSGPAMVMSAVVGESFLWGPVRALRRDLGTFTGRETVIVPLNEGGLEEVELLVSMYDAEPAWLDSALARIGFPPMSILNQVDKG